MEDQVGESAAATVETVSLPPVPSETKGMISAKDLRTTAKEAMTLIDRFYDGGNMARPEALDILVVVLDGVVRGMREQYARRANARALCNQRIKEIDDAVARIRPKQEK